MASSDLAEIVAETSIYGAVTKTNDAGAGIINNWARHVLDDYRFTSRSGTQRVAVRGPGPRRRRLRHGGRRHGVPLHGGGRGPTGSTWGPELRELRAVEGSQRHRPDQLDRLVCRRWGSRARSPARRWPAPRTATTPSSPSPPLVRQHRDHRRHHRSCRWQTSSSPRRRRPPSGPPTTARWPSARPGAWSRPTSSSRRRRPSSPAAGSPRSSDIVVTATNEAQPHGPRGLHDLGPRGQERRPGLQLGRLAPQQRAVQPRRGRARVDADLDGLRRRDPRPGVRDRLRQRAARGGRHPRQRQRPGADRRPRGQREHLRRGWLDLLRPSRRQRRDQHPEGRRLRQERPRVGGVVASNKVSSAAIATITGGTTTAGGDVTVEAIDRSAIISHSVVVQSATATSSARRRHRRGQLLPLPQRLRVHDGLRDRAPS